jgi:hypothetical protein
MSENERDGTLNKGLQFAKDAVVEKIVEIAHRGSANTKSETLYNVVFTGSFTKEEKAVIAAMAKFFKQGQESTRRLLQAGRVIKSYDNKMSADKLVKMLGSVGLACKVETEVIGGTEDASLLAKAAFKLDETRLPHLGIPARASFTRRHGMALASMVAGVTAAVLWILFMPPVVKGNSFATYEASVQKVIDRAPVDQKQKLRSAVDYLTGSEFEFHKRNTGGGNEEVAANLAYGSIGGMNADHIIAAAEAALEIKRKGYRDEIGSIRKAITDERAAMAQVAASNTELNKLELSNPRFSWSRGDAPQMDMKLVNNSSETLSRVYVQEYLYAADGKLMATAPASYGTAFGIPPSGTQYLTLFARAGDTWTTQEIRDNWQNMLFKATVENAENVNGKLIGVDLRPMRKKIEEDEAQARKLEKELAEIKL